MVTWLKPVWIVDENDKVEEEAEKPGNEFNDGTDEDTFVDRTAAVRNVDWHFSSLTKYCVDLSMELMLKLINSLDKFW